MAPVVAGAVNTACRMRLGLLLRSSEEILGGGGDGDRKSGRNPRTQNDAMQKAAKRTGGEAVLIGVEKRVGLWLGTVGRGGSSSASLGAVTQTCGCEFTEGEKCRNLPTGRRKGVVRRGATAGVGGERKGLGQENLIGGPV